MLGVITRVSELAQRGTKKALNKVRQVKELLHDATANQPPLPPRTQRLSTTTSLVNADTPIGRVGIGENAMFLTANMLFTMVRDLQAKVDILTKGSKSTGVIFDLRAFSLETEFVL